MMPTDRAGPAAVRLVGVTGRIGSGKSTLCRLLADRYGCALIGADELGHDALERDPSVREGVLRRFGSGILDGGGRIDRSRLASIVFSDPSARRDLNALVHPWIMRQIAARLAALREEGRTGIVLLDAALLLDWIDLIPCDRVVVVRCADETAIRRLAGRGIGQAEARRRLASQDPESRVLQHADFVVENDGAEGDLMKEAERLWRSLNAGREERNR